MTCCEFCSEERDFMPIIAEKEQVITEKRAPAEPVALRDKKS
jgi:hypothetical protein